MAPLHTGEISKMLKKVTSVILLALISVAVFLYIKTGAYKGVDVELSSLPSYQIFYKEHTGPYHEILTSLKEVEDFFQELGTPCQKTFGLFLDDPAAVDHENLKSHVGCAFTKEHSPQVFNLPEGILESFLSSQDSQCYKGVFKGSPSLTAIKVYPRLQEKADKDKVKLKTEALEVYETTNGVTTTSVYRCKLS